MPRCGGVGERVLSHADGSVSSRHGSRELVLCPGNIFVKSFDLREYGFGRGDPDEGRGLAIPAGDEFIDLAGQLPDDRERPLANGLLRDESEPALHLIEP